MTLRPLVAFAAFLGSGFAFGPIAVLTQPTWVPAGGTAAVTGGVTMTGTLQPGSALSGAGVITWNSGPIPYTINFGAFDGAGTIQSSAQAMTGVLMGDACEVSSATSHLSSIGQLDARPTSAGNIAVIAGPISPTATDNPTSDTYYVRCTR